MAASLEGEAMSKVIVISFLAGVTIDLMTIVILLNPPPLLVLNVTVSVTKDLYWAGAANDPKPDDRQVTGE